MNKLSRTLTGTLAGLAVVAAAGLAPAFAGSGFIKQGNVPFNFVNGSTSSYLLNNAPVTFFDSATRTSEMGNLTLSGSGLEPGSSFVYDNTILDFTPNTGNGFVLDGISRVALSGTGSNETATVSSVGNSFGQNFNFTLAGYPVNNVPAAVPEASTVLSFGALLVLGGVAVLRRKAVKNAA